MKINAVICVKCCDIIWSRAVHDFRTCTCGEIFIDGGFDYIRTNAGKTKIIDVDCTVQEAYNDWNNKINKLGSIKQKKESKQ